jgi:peptide chain release factor 1
MRWQERVVEVRQRHAELTERLSDPAVLGTAICCVRSRGAVGADAGGGGGGGAGAGAAQLADARSIIEAGRGRGAGRAGGVGGGGARGGRSGWRRRCALLLPKDPLADRAAVVEIRAGTGGDEAGLFAADLFRMYTRYAETRGWRVELVDLSEGERGAYKEVVFVVRGHERVRRPALGVRRAPRAAGAGDGEPGPDPHVGGDGGGAAGGGGGGRRDPGRGHPRRRVPVVGAGRPVGEHDGLGGADHAHPDGLVVTCQDEKSQLKNKVKALKVLRSRLLDAKIAEQEAARARDRKTQVGTGDRSAKIRTYNFPQGRVTDHRIGLTLHRLQDVLDGDLDELVEALKLAREAEQLEAPAAERRGGDAARSGAGPQGGRRARRAGHRDSRGWTRSCCSPTCSACAGSTSTCSMNGRSTRRSWSGSGAVRRRLRREPLQYILGTAAFRQLELQVDRGC